MLATLAVYFLLLFFISRRVAGSDDNETFFRANRHSSWKMVAFGMIGASISGVSFVSVPGWVGTTQMTYLQMCMGFIVGYVVVAFLLLPLYYRLRLTSIYTYLRFRFGARSHGVGAAFFLLSKLTGAAARLYLVCLILQQFVAAPWGIPFPLTALATVVLIWLYTRRSGMRGLVFTDVVQTLCLLIALVGVLVATAWALGLDAGACLTTVTGHPLSKVFEWDAASPRAFWRQFLSGVFIVIVMTGLDQDMMQKNLTCRSLREAQKDMCAYGLAFLPVNALFLGLGVLLTVLAGQEGVTASGDQLLPALVASGALGKWVILPFTIGIVAAAFSSADSALTSLTTSVCVDILGVERRSLSSGEASRRRMAVHRWMAAAFFVCVLSFYAVGSTSVINAIYTMASYTYGPLLGLFAFGELSRRRVVDGAVPFVAVAAPVLCGLLDYFSPRLWGYTFGYELLLLNGLLTMGGLWLFSRRPPREDGERDSERPASLA